MEIVVDLDYPVQFEDRTVEQIRFRRSKVRDQIAVMRAAKERGIRPEDEVEFSACVLAQLSGEPYDLIMELDTADFSKAANKVNDFFTFQK